MIRLISNKQNLKQLTFTWNNINNNILTILYNKYTNYYEWVIYNEITSITTYFKKQILLFCMFETN